MIYEYRCTNCHHEWEEEQSIKEPPIEHCSFCKKPNAKRLISRSSFILQGSGWYKDGYSGGSKK